MDLLVRAEKMDLLSNLPDDVLLRILSFLTTKQAALTSVLSKRWRNLSVLAPNLDIRDSLFRYREAPYEEWGHIRQLFMDFVDKVFALRGDSPIKRFSLTFIIVDSDRVGAWIRNVLVRGVSELELSMPSIQYCRRYDFDICWLDGRKYPMLKTLVLDSVSLSVDRFENLLHALPALEELVLRYIYWKSRNGFHLIVSSACLKTLTIYSFKCCLDTYTFDTPSLVNFCYSDYGSQDYSVAKMENLLEAQIRLLVPEDEIKRARVDLQGNVVLRFASVGKLMNGIRNVQYLNICAVTLEVLSRCCESMPVFNNLESLTIESNKNQGFQGTMKELRMVKHFLVYLPCLKEIKICIEGNGLEHIRVPEMSEGIAEMIELNNKLSSCNVQLLVNGCLYKKWTAQ